MDNNRFADFMQEIFLAVLTGISIMEKSVSTEIAKILFRERSRLMFLIEHRLSAPDGF